MDLKEIKKKLVEKAENNMVEDVKANRAYWSDVASELRISKTEEDFIRIAKYDFGLESLEGIIKKEL